MKYKIRDSNLKGQGETRLRDKCIRKYLQGAYSLAEAAKRYGVTAEEFVSLLPPSTFWEIERRMWERIYD